VSILAGTICDKHTFALVANQLYAALIGRPIVKSGDEFDARRLGSSACDYGSRGALNVLCGDDRYISDRKKQRFISLTLLSVIGVALS
jgi:hypothetical protein